MSDPTLKSSHIVIADGPQASGRPIEAILRADGYRQLRRAAGAAEAVALCRQLRVELLVLELELGETGAEGALAQLAPLIDTGRLSVLVVAARNARAARDRALRCGAHDFIALPLDPCEVTLRVAGALRARALAAGLAGANAAATAAAAAHADELSRARRELLAHLAVAAEFRDDDTGEHTARVGRCSAELAAACGLPAESVRIIAAAAPLHDIGKLGIPDQILLKAQRHTRAEAEIMRTHTEIGAAILSDSEVPELRAARAIALSHHERWDGSGYPHAISGVAIPLAARIVAIADVFDALVFPRAYRDAWSLPAALGEIASQRGRQFDAHLVDVFLGLDHEHLRSPVDPDGGGAHGTRIFRAAAELRTRRLVSVGARLGEPAEQAASGLAGRP